MRRYVTIKETSVWVRHTLAVTVFGSALRLPGGTELVDEAGTGGPMVINDPYFPPLRVIVVQPDELLPLSSELSGPRANTARATCAHATTRRGGKPSGCLACYYRAWTARAAALGIAPSALGVAPQTKEPPHAEPSAQTADSPPKRRRRPRKGEAEL